MKRKIQKSLIWLSLSISGVGLLLFIAYKTLLQGLYTPQLSSIMTFFWVLEAIVVVSLANASEKGGQTYTNTFLVLKTLKIILSAIFCGVSLFIVKEGRLNFVIAFAIFYFISLAFETFSSTKLNKKLKNEVAKK